MKRFWILVLTEFKAWRREPITALGGFIPSIFILLAFGLLFGGRLTFKIGFVNNDQGQKGALLADVFAEVLSPFGTPYYDVVGMSEEEVWRAYEEHRIDGVWVVPADLSERIEAGTNPLIDMHFSNYNDDRAKNHRIYAPEVLWRFYEKVEYPEPPLAVAEEYPRQEYVEWVPVIAVGVALMSFMLGAMVNIFMLTHREHVAGLTLEFGLAPRNLAWILGAKTLVALTMGLLTGTGLLAILYAWLGVWPGRFLGAVWLLAALVALFWIPLTLLLGMRARYFPGVVTAILTGLIAFFVGGGLGLVRSNWRNVHWFSRIFPNTYAVDPLRDMILFGAWPVDWARTVLILLAFAAVSMVVGLSMAARQLRRLG